MFFYVEVCLCEWGCYYSLLKTLSHWCADVCCGLSQRIQITIITHAVRRRVQHSWTESLTHSSTFVLHNLRSHSFAVCMTCTLTSFRYSFYEKTLSSGQMEAVNSQKEYTDIHTRLIVSVVSELAMLTYEHLGLQVLWVVSGVAASHHIKAPLPACDIQKRPQWCGINDLFNVFLGMEQFISCLRFWHISIKHDKY